MAKDGKGRADPAPAPFRLLGRRDGTAQPAGRIVARIVGHERTRGGPAAAGGGLRPARASDWPRGAGRSVDATVAPDRAPGEPARSAVGPRVEHALPGSGQQRSLAALFLWPTGVGPRSDDGRAASRGGLVRTTESPRNPSGRDWLVVGGAGTWGKKSVQALRSIGPGGSGLMFGERNWPRPAEVRVPGGLPPMGRLVARRAGG